MRRAAILGVGSYVPEQVIPNHYFACNLETTDEWIVKRTGIRYRHIAARHQATSDLCLEAAQFALANANLTAKDVDLILVATTTPDFPLPSTACLLQRKLGIGEYSVPSFDLNAACCGFLYALTTAKAYVESGLADKILVVGADVISRIVDYEDRNTCILFGDGAGAVVVGMQRGDTGHMVSSVRLGADGRGADLLIVPAGGSAVPASAATVSDKLHSLRLKGREVFRFAVSKMAELIEDAAIRSGIRPSDFGVIIPHQANIRIIEAVAERLGLPKTLFFSNLENVGNTSAASIPLALDAAASQRVIPPKHPVLLLGFGAGLTWGYAVIHW